ncbi:hypothetical protein J1614_001967 [Plenodomus biglobosus]|nr:hypothetical protein J1614_001967 [Plenodomus biglobosus]
MRLYTVISAVVKWRLLPFLATAGVAGESMELALDNDFALNTSILDADTTNCTITLTKHTETMTCIFSKPKTHTVNCARSQRSNNNSPPLRIRITGVDNVTYVPENPESMLNIFVARDLYRDHKAKLKRPMTARDDMAYDLEAQHHDLVKTKNEIRVALALMLLLLTVIVSTVAMFNTRHMFKMGSSDQKEVLDLALQRNDLIDKIRECSRQKKWLQAELAKVKVEEDKDDSDRLSVATIVS